MSGYKGSNNHTDNFNYCWQRHNSLPVDDDKFWAIAAGLFAIARAIEDKGTPNQGIRDVVETLRAKGVDV